MGVIVDLPAPPSGGTYFIVVEPEVIRVGTSSNIKTRLSNIRVNTFRRVALLAWTSSPEQYVHESFVADRITLTRGFFRLSTNLLHFINKCRVDLGFEEVEAILLWEFGGPLPYDGIPRSVPSRVFQSGTKDEKSARNGRYYTHLRWHRNKPKASCEFCIQNHQAR
jgi:hypothetical protein